MIKNDTNKQTETKPAITVPAMAPTTMTTVRQPSNEVDNRHALTSNIQRTVINKYNEVDDNDAAKPLTKSDLIKKFDSKYKQSESVDNKQSHRTSYEEKHKCIPDEVENDENIQNSNDESGDIEIHRQSSESETNTVANNNYKNENAYAGNSNGNEAVPPKPLPRTSRNNSISSLSSEHSISIANPVEETTRPVAKPRTTTTSYKVLPTTTFYQLFCTVSVFFLLHIFCIWVFLHILFHWFYGFIFVYRRFVCRLIHF